MMRLLFSYKCVVAASGFLIVPFTVEATQITVSASQPKPPAYVSEDPAQWRRDPFLGSLKKVDVRAAAKSIPLKSGSGPLKLEQEQRQDIQLQGIMQADRSFHALINGRSVKTGDTIDGVTIKEISRFRVVVLNERKEKVIYDIYQGRIDRGKK